ncbi:MAG: hypothetical protein Fur0041_02580 [Bacteroidia bacterium]
MKKAVVSVINDLVTDQRVHKSCMALHSYGFDVLLVGRERKGSLPMNTRPYRSHRMKLLFEKGVPFYFFFQLRLLWLLLRNPADLYFANDLDTLWPNYLVSRIRRKPLIYDSHEIFTEVPELTERPFKQNVWKMLEQRIVPKLKYMFTVNDSIAEWFHAQYGIKPFVMRNIPRKNTAVLSLTRKEAGLPEDKKIILLQGAGINIHRGAEEAVEAMKYLDNMLLLIIGGGDVLPVLKETVRTQQLQDKVVFMDKMPPEKLRQFTALADAGITLDKDTNINYRYSLPNKIFDYIHAGIPVIASDLKEVAGIVRKYNVGIVIRDLTPQSLAKEIAAMLNAQEFPVWKKNAEKAAEELNWENEEQRLFIVLDEIFPQKR